VKRFADVTVSLPVEGFFSYEIPATIVKDVQVGKRVLVPFGKRTITGYVIELKDKPAIENPKKIIDVLDDVPIFDKKRFSFFKWLASYYFAPLGEVLSLIHPNPANIRSHRYFRLTEAGGSALDHIEGVKREVLEAAGRGVTLTRLLKRFKGRAVQSTVEALKREGLLTEEIRLSGGVKAKFETFLSIAPGVTPGGVLKEIERYPLQLKVFNYLIEKGETPLRLLRKELAAVDRAVKRLEEKGFLVATKKEVIRDPVGAIPPRLHDHEPNPEQRNVLEILTGAITANGKFSPYLLYGVTGSGKTLVYLKAIENAVEAGRSVIFLVPEIALTSRAVAYLSGNFPGRVAVVHSGLSEGERFDQWRRIVKGEVDIVIGARSALFSPLKDPGLIVVDEEHETSYKQEEGVRYNARDAALMLGKFLGATVVLGSATPSVETFYNTKVGKITSLYLTERVRGLKLPPVELLDMKGEKGKVISERLKGLITQTLEEGHQVLLFLNRRGFSSFLVCNDCGHIPRCLNCSVTLTMHKASRALRCHYCDMSTALPERCTACGGHKLVDPGMGTEKVEEEIRRHFPGYRVGRMDRDTTRRKGAARKIIDAVEDGLVDVLVGTQMVSKGHHFPGISLVGVLSGDTSLNIPDFRSSERTFQLIAQAAGRTGRGQAPARVLIQTLNPEHFCFVKAVDHDYEGFFEEELMTRREAAYPPFTRLCLVRVEGTNEERVVRASAVLKDLADKKLKRTGMKISVLGPAPALLSKLKGRFRWQILLKGKDIKSLHTVLGEIKRGFEEERFRGASLTIDVDPITTV
jgi:primosomal protein N' (replication factor Y)